MSFKDKVTTTDRITAGLDTSTAVIEPCPKCGKGSKELPDGKRRCALCGHLFAAKTLTTEN